MEKTFTIAYALGSEDKRLLPEAYGTWCATLDEKIILIWDQEIQALGATNSHILKCRM
jgi:hypothetical protein